MRRTRLDHWPCSIARTVDLIGDGWTPMILREAYYGVKRFDDFEANLGLGRNVLTQRLKRLVKEGVFDKVSYQRHPPRHEYVLTEKGRSLFPVLAAMMRWGDVWLSKGEGAPVELVDRESGRLLKAMVVDAETKKPIELGQVRTRLGPGFPKKLATWAMGTGRYAARKG